MVAERFHFISIVYTEAQGTTRDVRDAKLVFTVQDRKNAIEESGGLAVLWLSVRPIHDHWASIFSRATKQEKVLATTLE